MPITFFVPGIAKPAGSKKGFVVKGKNGGKPRAIVTDDCEKSRDWKTTCSMYAQEAYQGPLLSGVLLLEITFVMPRIGSHFRGKAKTLRENAPVYHVIRPDATKLTRAVEDALTAVIWHDDAQVAVQRIKKVYGDKPGALVTITEIPQEPTPA